MFRAHGGLHNHDTFRIGNSEEMKRTVHSLRRLLNQRGCLRRPSLQPQAPCPRLSTSLNRSARLIMSRYPYGLSPDITPTSTPTKLTKAQKSRARREPSGVFSLFSPPQIQQFREAFSLIDHDGDGIVNEQDLKHIFASLGVYPHIFLCSLTMQSH